MMKVKMKTFDLRERETMIIDSLVWFDSTLARLMHIPKNLFSLFAKIHKKKIE